MLCNGFIEILLGRKGVSDLLETLLDKLQGCAVVVTNIVSQMLLIIPAFRWVCITEAFVFWVPKS